MYNYTVVIIIITPCDLRTDIWIEQRGPPKFDKVEQRWALITKFNKIEQRLALILETVKLSRGGHSYRSSIKLSRGGHSY